jgi:hypothetical protein
MSTSEDRLDLRTSDKSSTSSPTLEPDSEDSFSLPASDNVPFRLLY